MCIFHAGNASQLGASRSCCSSCSCGRSEQQLELPSLHPDQCPAHHPLRGLPQKSPAQGQPTHTPGQCLHGLHLRLCSTLHGVSVVCKPCCANALLSRVALEAYSAQPSPTDRLPLDRPLAFGLCPWLSLVACDSLNCAYAEGGPCYLWHKGPTYYL